MLIALAVRLNIVASTKPQHTPVETMSGRYVCTVCSILITAPLKKYVAEHDSYNHCNHYRND